MMDPDVYFKKVIVFKHAKKTLRFRVSQDLFSSYQIDIGTAFLLRTLLECTPPEGFEKVLDLGCGYGPLGLTLKKTGAARAVQLTDRDALAVSYTQQNAALNQLKQGVSVYGSLGFDDIQATDFDLIVSNIPGKAGERMIAHLLLAPVHYLRPGGRVAVVVVAPLEPFVLETLSDLHIHILAREARSGHTVFHYQFAPEYTSPWPKPEGKMMALERGVYERKHMTVEENDLTFPMQTAYGLPEFDLLDYKTVLLMAGLQSLQDADIARVLAFNLGQGHTAVAMWHLFQPEHFMLVDRDLLALRYTRQNLILNSCPAQRIILSHQVGLQAQADVPSADLIVGTLREEEGPEAVVLTLQQAATYLAPQGTILVAGTSTGITRLEKALRAGALFTIKKRKRKKGHSLLILVPKGSLS